MTIHHDKLAYGKVAAVKEEADEEKLRRMAERLSAKADVQDGEHKPDGGQTCQK